MAAAKPKQATRKGNLLRRIDLRWWGNSFVLILLVLGITWGWHFIHEPLRFPIEKVAVEGSFKHLNKIEVQQALTPLVTGNFFDVSGGAITKKLLQMPWVAQVTVRKVWPNKLEILVKEQQPVARFGQQGLLNAQGQLFTPPGFLPNNLPQLDGPANNQKLILQSYWEINELLATLHLSVVELDLSARMSWHMVLSNGTAVTIGSIDPLKRLQRFVKVYPKIFGQNGANAEYVDLRYNNGIAVKWKLGSQDSHGKAAG